MSLAKIRKLRASSRPFTRNISVQVYLSTAFCWSRCRWSWTLRRAGGGCGVQSLREQHILGQLLKLKAHSTHIHTRTMFVDLVCKYATNVVSTCSIAWMAAAHACAYTQRRNRRACVHAARITRVLARVRAAMMECASIAAERRAQRTSNCNNTDTDKSHCGDNEIMVSAI